MTARLELPPESDDGSHYFAISRKRENESVTITYKTWGELFEFFIPVNSLDKGNWRSIWEMLQLRAKRAKRAKKEKSTDENSLL